MNIANIFNIDEAAGIPKYRQIINSACMAIEQGILKKGDKIASINQICGELSLSRDTVMLKLSGRWRNGMYKKWRLISLFRIVIW